MTNYTKSCKLKGNNNSCDCEIMKVTLEDESC